MIRKFTLLFLACLGSYSLSVAQPVPVCGFDARHQKLMATDPSYANSVNQINTSIANWLNQQQNGPQGLAVTLNGNKAWEIPVVVHVIHTGQAVGSLYNPSDGKIDTMIQYLSQAYQANYAGTPAHAQDGLGGTRIPIVFKLATRTPACGSTNGIVRINASSNTVYAADGVSTDFGNEPGIDDAALKAMSYWPNNTYYNIWIVNKIDGINLANATTQFTAGYAQLPTGGVSPTDGTVMLADQVGAGKTVITHELGHAFNLRHTFQGGCGATAGTPGCNFDGDFVCDTEPMAQHAANLCPTTNSCTSAPWLNNNTVRNFMNYCSCPDRFTTGQRTRIWNSFNNATVANTTIRSSLISSLGATPFPTVSVRPYTDYCGGNAPTGPSAPSNIFLGPIAVTIIKPRGASTPTSDPDSFIMNIISGSYTNENNQHYVDRACHHRAELTAGQSYRFRVGVNNGFQFNQHASAWIDYNNNGVFENSERVYTITNAANGTMQTQTFIPPLTAVSCVPLRGRVIATNSGATITDPCLSPINGQAEDFEVMIQGGTGSGGTIVPGLVDVYIPSNIGNPSCANTAIAIHATKANNVTPVWYSWFKKNGSSFLAGPSGAWDSVWASTSAGIYAHSNFVTNDTVYVKMAFPGLCAADTTTDTIILNRPPFIPPSVDIGVTAGTNPTCVDETVTLSIVGAVNNGSATGYTWYRVGSATALGTGTSYNVLNGPNGARYYLVMTLNPTTCNNNTTTVHSDTIQINHTTKTPTVTIALTTGLNPGCPGQLLTYSVTANTVAGTNPSYQWKVNNVNQPGATGANFSGVFNAGDVISVEMTSSSSCAVPATASHSAPAIQHQTLTADVTIAQISGGNPVCSGHPAVFTATPTNAGTSPQFQWLVNNNPIIGANSPTLNISSLLNNDAVSVILIATDPCVSNAFDTSNYIMMQVTPSKAPQISFTITAGNNPGCLDSLVEFTATTTDAGTTPDIEWLVNSFPLNLNSVVYSTTNLLNNDVVTARVVPTDGQCYLPDTAFSAPMTMVRSVTPEPPIISLINNMLITNKSGSFVWFGPAGQLTGGDDGKFHPTELGKYWAVTNNNGCWSKPSNILTITLLDINSLDMEPVTIYPNPTSGMLNIEWGRNVSMNVSVYTTVGQKMLTEQVNNQQRKVIDMSSLASGMYFVVLTDGEGRTSTTRITVSK